MSPETMTGTTNSHTPQWLTVDEGWGRRAADWASLLEPACCREYVTMHHLLGIGPGERVLDIACGSGLALELAAIRGAEAAGIDASPRLIAVALDRLPQGDIRVGDMAALPWDDGSFDVVTSFRGIWATTRPALAEAHRVLRPGGRIALTSWGRVKDSPGAWGLMPLLLAAEDKVRAQADMASLGRPEVGETFLAQAGFVNISRHSILSAWEFADPEHYARAISASGPAFESIQQVGEEQFYEQCVALASERVRTGLPLRAEIALVGFTASIPTC